MIIEIYDTYCLNSEGTLVCIDRDDTLIEDLGYMGSNVNLRVNENLVSDLLRRFASTVNFCLVSNQSGIERGLISFDDVINLNKSLRNLLWNMSMNLSASIFCPHLPESKCRCRKPQSLMLDTARKLYGNPVLEDCYYIGDRVTDEQAALNAGFIFEQVRF